MRHKPIYLFTLILVALFSNIACYGENKTTSSNPSSVIIASLPRKTWNQPSNRPRIPSNSYIDMAYYTEVWKISFTILNGISSLSVEIENLDSGEIHYGVVDASYPVMDVYLEPATYSITCTTDDGCIYEGEFDVE